MKKSSAILVLLLILHQVVTAQDFRKISYEEYALGNGLHVILHVDRSAPVAATYMLYKVGSKNEEQDRTGFAHFFEHLMFEGSENIARGTMDKMITAAGGQLNASTSFDQTDYYFLVPANQLQLALWIESERMLHLKIDSLGVETQRKVVKEEKKQRMENQPYGSLLENLFKNTFPGTPYEWTPIGSAQYIDRASVEEFRQFHRTYYIPNNACLVVAGDINVEQTKKWIDAYFGNIPGGEKPVQPKVRLKEQADERRLVVEEKMTPLPALIVSYPTIGQHHPDSYALDFLSKILATGRSSRLYRRLVDQDQIAIQAASFPFLLDQAGMFAFLAVANQGIQIELMQTAIDEEIARVRDEGVSEEEFGKIRNQAEAEFVSSFGSVLAKARKLASYYLFYNDTELINTELQKFMNVRREDIQRVARTYLAPQSRNIFEYVVVAK